MSARAATPDSFADEPPSAPTPIRAAPTSTAAFVGPTGAGPRLEPVKLASWSEYEREFGPARGATAHAVRSYFDNGGRRPRVVRTRSRAPAAIRAGLGALGESRFQLLCLPASRRKALAPETLAAAAAFCEERRAFLIVDSDPRWQSRADALAGLEALPTRSANAALYFPWPLREHEGGPGRALPPCGAVAGVYARTDREQGVWKAPAGTEAALMGMSGVAQRLSGDDFEELGRHAVNPLRELPGAGVVIWGARTLAGADGGGSEYRYVPVRRFALFLEASIEEGTKWAVFEPNDEPLWSQLRRAVAAFLDDLFRRGAFAASTPREAYFIKCDAQTTTAADIVAGRVNILVGFAPLKPAEFVLIKIQQLAGQQRPE